MHPACLRNLRIASVAITLFAGAIAATPVPAQTWGDIIAGAIKQGMINNAVKKWNAVDPDVRQCLASNYGLDLNNLAQQTITPDDYRLQNQMQYCQQAVAQARYQAEQQQRALEEQRAAQQRAVEEAQRAQEQAAEQARRDQAARDAAAKAQVEVRHKGLVARFGSEQADAIESGRVIVGMSRDAVIAARGQPDNKEVIPPDDEMWVYGSQRISISKGKVTYVGH